MGRQRHHAAPIATAAVLELEPYDVSGPLPAWSPIPPAGGWTPASAWDAALHYADDHATEYDLTHRRAARVAFRALCVAVPAVHRAWTIERLHGVDVTHRD